MTPQFTPGEDPDVLGNQRDPSGFNTGDNAPSTTERNAFLKELEHIHEEFVQKSGIPRKLLEGIPNTFPVYRKTSDVEHLPTESAAAAYFAEPYIQAPSAPNGTPTHCDPNLQGMVFSVNKGFATSYNLALLNRDYIHELIHIIAIRNRAISIMNHGVQETVAVGLESKIVPKGTPGISDYKRGQWATVVCSSGLRPKDNYHTHHADRSRVIAYLAGESIFQDTERYDMWKMLVQLADKGDRMNRPPTNDETDEVIENVFGRQSINVLRSPAFRDIETRSRTEMIVFQNREKTDAILLPVTMEELSDHGVQADGAWNPVRYTVKYSTEQVPYVINMHGEGKTPLNKQPAPGSVEVDQDAEHMIHCLKMSQLEEVVMQNPNGPLSDFQTATFSFPCDSHIQPVTLHRHAQQNKRRVTRKKSGKRGRRRKR